MSRKLSLLFCLSIISMFIMTSCAATTLTSVWKDKNYTGHLKKVIVIAASQNPDVRTAFEKEYVTQFKSLDIDAVPSHYTIYPEKMLDKDTIVSTIKDLDIDAVLITMLSNKYTVNYRATDWHESYKESYRSTRREREQKDVTYYVDTKLFDVKTEKLIWSATSETFILSGDSVYKEIKPFIKVMVDNLASQDFLK